MANEEAVKPCLRAFWEERALPSGVRGPVECLALARLASCCFSEMGLSESGNGNTSRPSGSTRVGWSLKLAEATDGAATGCAAGAMVNGRAAMMEACIRWFLVWTGYGFTVKRSEGARRC